MKHNVTLPLTRLCRYKWQTPDLHTKLFAKIPFPLSGATSNDRLSSSVNKQPMDFYEINAYRLLEASMPVKTPKFYFGDISNESSNFILITERVPFTGMPPLKPFEIEGPYVKCKDYEMEGTDKDHYRLLMQVHARIAAAHKTGKMGTEDFLQQNLMFNNIAWHPIQPDSASGAPPQVVAGQLRVATKFFSETAKVLYPDYVTTQAFQEKFFNTMMLANAYQKELMYWKLQDIDYVALGHQNLNVDNAYFWRDDKDVLDCGIFDLGGLTVGYKGTVAVGGVLLSASVRNRVYVQACTRTKKHALQKQCRTQ